MKHSRVDPAEWERYKKDPQREHKKGDDFAVCRECPEKHRALQRHIVAKHGITVQEYLQKWGNPPLIAPSVPDILRGKHAGKPRLYARGKKWLGDNIQGKKRGEENRNNHAKREVAPVDDATLAQGRLAGKSITEIAAEASVTHAAVVRRLKRMGFAPGGPYLFLHAQPIAKKHFDDLREDFDVDFKEIIEVIGKHPHYEVTKRLRGQSDGWRKGSAGKAPRSYYDCLVNHIKRREDPAGILLARFANIVLDARKRWTEAFCFDYRARWKRIRSFLQSEVRDLPELFQLLKKPLSALRIWLRDQEIRSIKPPDILNWICEQSRLEVAHDDGRAFRGLMFLWPALERLLDRNGLNRLVDQKYANEAVYELLAEDYGATAHAIRNAIRGAVKPLLPQTLGQIIRAQLANPHRSDITAELTKGPEVMGALKVPAQRPAHRPIEKATENRIMLAVRLEIDGLKPYAMTDHLYPPSGDLPAGKKAADRRRRFDATNQFLRRYRKRIDLEKQLAVPPESSTKSPHPLRAD